MGVFHEAGEVFRRLVGGDAVDEQRGRSPVGSVGGGERELVGGEEIGAVAGCEGEPGFDAGFERGVEGDEGFAGVWEGFAEEDVAACFGEDAGEVRMRTACFGGICFGGAEVRAVAVGEGSDGTGDAVGAGNGTAAEGYGLLSELMPRFGEDGRTGAEGVGRVDGRAGMGVGAVDVGDSVGSRFEGVGAPAGERCVDVSCEEFAAEGTVENGDGALQHATLASSTVDAIDAGGAMSDMTPEQAAQAAEQFRQDYKAVRDQVGKVVVGHRDVVDGVLTCLFTSGHVLLEGVPGIGKTLLIRTLSEALRLSFSRIQFTPDLMPADISGTTVVHEIEDTETGGRQREFRFQQGPIFAQIVLADEINRATPKTQSALLEAMQERSVTVAGTSHRLPAPFFVMATQNPIEQEGTYPLPEAQLDRFFFKLLVGYSGRSELSEILNRTTSGTAPTVEPVLDGERIVQHQQLVRRVAIAPHVQDYAVRAVMATHPAGPDGGGQFATPMVNQFVRVGASPRAAQALVLGGKSRALLDGRAAVAVDDIKAIALAALRHRIILNFEGQAEGLTTDAVIENILTTLPVEAAMA